MISSALLLTESGVAPTKMNSCVVSPWTPIQAQIYEQLQFNPSITGPQGESIDGGVKRLQLTENMLYTDCTDNPPIISCAPFGYDCFKCASASTHCNDDTSIAENTSAKVQKCQYYGERYEKQMDGTITVSPHEIHSKDNNIVSDEKQIMCGEKWKFQYLFHRARWRARNFTLVDLAGHCPLNQNRLRLTRVKIQISGTDRGTKKPLTELQICG